MVWKFDAAPADLKALHKGAEPPKWLALVPGAVHGVDLEAAIMAHARFNGLDKYRTEAGDVVYVGSSDLVQFIDAEVRNPSAGRA
jgi:hypothetical protein